ncbi:hypothetical protein OOZ15_19505 [Galbibacter sp. EGI 63066]|uniref:toxin-antitoxin system YwqK family antitoxin n=1 Tax=Galbibacter sp. EGI 63066 TaxID=2993559 RepID=UPI0022495B12|nr:hypothetical protein [Galbibacter sp. EGI 63066]MCX2682142.1 hypothetical protein [Galbibacter sp. EGI 63066]
MILFFSCKRETHFVESHYYKTGSLLNEVSYRIEDTVKDGISKEYYENGSIKKIVNYENGKLKDTSKIFFDSGELEFLEVRTKDTIYTYHYYKNGKTSIKGNFLNTNPPKEIGWFRLFSDNGMLTDSIEYVIIEGNSILNQRKHYRNNSILMDSSNFYNFKLSKISNNSTLHQLKIKYIPEIKEAQTYLVISDSTYTGYDDIDESILDTFYMENNELIAKKAFDKKYKKLMGFFYEYNPIVKDTLENDSIRIIIQEKKVYFNETVYVTDTIDK